MSSKMQGVCNMTSLLLLVFLVLFCFCFCRGVFCFICVSFDIVCVFVSFSFLFVFVLWCCVGLLNALASSLRAFKSLWQEFLKIVFFNTRR